MKTRAPLRSALIVSAALAVAFIVVPAVSGSGQSRKKQVEHAPLLDGDIVFQYSGSAQCPAIAQATRSPYTHCGIVFIEQGEPMVWEAVGPVLKTPFKDWVQHGVNGHYVVKRLKDRTSLSPEVLEAMRAEGMREMGRPYDIWFDMDEERIYCSELVWKIYERGAHIRVGELERFGDMDFTGAEAKRVLKDRFGDRFPSEQQVITPASIFRSTQLLTVEAKGTAPGIP